MRKVETQRRGFDVGAAIVGTVVALKAAVALVVSAVVVVSAAYASEVLSCVLVAGGVGGWVAAAALRLWLVAAFSLAAGVSSLIARELAAEGCGLARFLRMASVAAPLALLGTEVAMLAVCFAPSLAEGLAAGDQDAVFSLVILVIGAFVVAKLALMAMRVRNPFVRAFVLCVLAVCGLPAAVAAAFGALVVFVLVLAFFLALAMLPWMMRLAFWAARCG